jgi:hypothetical protein
MRRGHVCEVWGPSTAAKGKRTKAKRLRKPTVCAECEVERSGVPRDCKRNVRGVVYVSGAAIAQAIDSLVERRFERVRCVVRPERAHDAAHHRVGQRERADGIRAANASAASARETVDLPRAQPHDAQRTNEGAHVPVDHVREVHVPAAGGRTSPACASREPAIQLGSRGTLGLRPGSSASVRTRASGASCALATAAMPAANRA